MNENSQSKHAFHYDASAHALSGRFWRPFQRVIEVQAPSVLPSIGGMGNSRVDNFRLDDLVSFKAGYTHVVGSEMELKDAKGQSRIAHTTQVTSRYFWRHQKPSRYARFLETRVGNPQGHQSGCRS